MNTRNNQSAELSSFDGERGMPSVNEDRNARAKKGLFFLALLVILGLGIAAVVWKNKQRAAKAAEAQQTRAMSVSSAVPARTFSEPPPLPGSAPAPAEAIAPRVPAPTTNAQASAPPPLPGNAGAGAGVDGAAQRPVAMLDKSGSGLMAVSQKAAQGRDAGGAASVTPGGAEGAPGGAGGLGGGSAQGGGQLSSMLSSTRTPPRKAGHLGDRNFILAKGSFIDCALQTKLESTVPGMSSCMVTRNIYSDNGKVLLVERGSTIVGAGLTAAAIGYGGPLVALFVAMRKVRTLHGEARFATTGEIAKAGLFSKDGIIIGKWKNRFLVFPGMQFVLLAAPTRSGKGVGIVIPNLLNWSESVIVLDVKLENFLITSGFRRKHGQEVYLFNPFSMTEDAEGNPLEGRTHRYNPLGYVSDKPELRVQDIVGIGYVLYPGEGKDVFFDDAARNLFLGLTLYLCETPTLPRTIGELLRQSSGKGQPVKDHIKGLILERNFRELGSVRLNSAGEDDDAAIGAIMQIRECTMLEAAALCNRTPTMLVENMAKEHIAGIEQLLSEAGATYTTTYQLVPITEWNGEGLPPLTDECVNALNRFINNGDNTLTSILATFNAPLTIWSSPLVDAATSANDFDLREVRKKRMSIYLGVPANRLAEARLLINLIYSQLIGLNTNQLLHATPALKYRCLILGDEFTAPGKIGIIDKSNSFQAGYGLPLLTIVQSPGQIQADAPKGYGKEGGRTLMTNHACQIFYTPREQQDANEYSEALGYTTVHSRNRSHGRGSSSVSESTGEGAGQKRALMLPQELQEMSQREQIIRLENTKPIHCEKIAYYADPVFMDRLKSVSPTLGKLGKKLPTKAQLDATWGSGELAAPVPALDLDLHVAIVQARVRELTIADVQQGIDLDKLAFDASALTLPADDEELAPEEVEAMVDDFFGAIGAPDEDEADGEGEADPEDASDTAVAVRPAAAPKAAQKPPAAAAPAAKPGARPASTAGGTAPERSSIDLGVLHQKFGPGEALRQSASDRTADAGIER